MKNEAIAMIKMPFSAVRASAFCIPLLLVASCGTGSEGVQNTFVALDPPGWGQATTLGLSGSNVQYVRVEAMAPNGLPQIGVRMIIDSQYVVYAGRPTSLVGLTPLTLPYETTTSANGTVDFTVLYSWGTAISGDFTALQAWSGTGFGRTNITFTCTDPDTLNPPECP